MLQFNVLGFPVQVQWFFWLITVVLGGGLDARSRADWIEVALWVIVVFISILVHELGHALAARRYGNDSFIVLHGFGGLTVIPHARFTRDQSIWVSFSGPLAGFILGGISYALRKTINTEYLAFYTFISMMLHVNIVWTLVNLLPIMPMDGGQIFRELLGPSRFHIACFVGGTIAVLIAAYAGTQREVYLALMFGYFAWINFTNGTTEGGVLKR
jgi:Zn-dependent protease